MRVNVLSRRGALFLIPSMTVLSGCGAGGSGPDVAGTPLQSAASGQSVAGPASAASPAPAATAPAPPVVLASATKPASAVAPWFVAQRINALSFASRQGLTTVWGDYWERSETPSYALFEGQSQELGNAADGNHATYSGLDLGSGVEAMMLRVSAPTGAGAVEIRMDSPTGPLAGAACAIPSTGVVGRYRTVRCALDPTIANGRDRTLVFRFTGTSADVRFNWFGFWARDTVQRIDAMSSIQATDRPNPATPARAQAGTPTRTQAMLPEAGISQARTFGRWSPTQIGECPKWLHDTHWVRGEDGKAYPTWHPQVDYNPETGAYCTYAHDHGSDPAASEQFALGGMPAFGFVAENHEPDTPTLQRREDHVGYKVIVANRFQLYNRENSAEKRSCSLVIAVHVGTHSPDAFTNTAHELHTYGQCAGLEPFNARYFALFGRPGAFKEAEAQDCGLTIQSGVMPSPANQPNGGIHRSIPTASCFLRGTAEDQARLVHNRSIEYWLTGFLGGSFYYTIENPSRLHDPSLPSSMGRMVDLCYVPDHPLAATLRCQETVAASQARVPFDDPRSSFRGSVHSNTHFSAIQFGNSATSTVYTNAWGQNRSPSPDPSRGIIFRQLVPTTAFNYRVDGHASVVPKVDHSAGGRNGVRSPN